jgi:hypothetical protein
MHAVMNFRRAAEHQAPEPKKYESFLGEKSTFLWAMIQEVQFT